ncbi:MAG: helix-turn-helix domain-containing protein [Miniphocaeibacter sp.]|uniref:helix-turn-helix domain-containing protein n=1 Tax=Miniphocaeibacter sp. TaxID=3100973 RepID=UPI0017CE0AA1|nr:helix-turn-helix domain-containing protein [Gallicola sp.]
MSHKHLTMDDRNKIEVLKKENYSDRRIATLLDFINSTISREVKRCKGENSAKIAQNDYEEKSKIKYPVFL